MEKRISMENNVGFKDYIDRKFKKEESDIEFTLFKPERLSQF